MGWNEASMHRWLQAHLAPTGLRARFGSDAAALVRPLPRPTVCMDQTIEGVHYERGTPPARVGHKACARSLSDLAASAARPRAVLAAVAAPREVPEAWLRAVLRAIAATARAHGAELVGGDLATTEGPATIAVCALGELARARPPARDGARPGDALVVSGALGGSLRGRHLRFEPRVEQGLWLAARGARAMMDVSDGLALDASRMAAASGVRVDLERVPIHADARRAARADGRSALDHALHDGEDHELLAALPRKALARVLAEAGARCPQLVEVGRVRRGSGVWLPREEGGPLARWDGAGGWVHGA